MQKVSELFCSSNTPLGHSPQTTAPCAFAYRSARIRRLVRLGLAP